MWSCLSKAALIALGYEEVALDDFWQAFLQELDNLPNMEMGQLEVRPPLVQPSTWDAVRK